MNFEKLKKKVWQANKELKETGLVILAWGNASGVDREAGVMAIKPSGVDYEKLSSEDIVVLSLDTGEIVEGSLRPSSDTPTHLLLYQKFGSIGGVVHTHSTYATSWAQACREIPCLGTTHADHFYGPVPVTRQLTPEEIKSEYEHNTGKVIVERFSEGELSPEQLSAVLVPCHGVFTWGDDPMEALETAIVLEEVAKMALYTNLINRSGATRLKSGAMPAKPLPQVLLAKHFLRKHGPGAYYGQQD